MIPSPKVFRCFILFVAAFALLSALSSATTPSVDPNTKALVDGNTAFAANLYHRLATTEGNLFFSPYSISSALGMTYSGAGGNTAAEMKKALNFPTDQQNLGPEFKSLNDRVEKDARRDGIILGIANGLCLTEGNVSNDYKTLLKEQYDAEIFSGGVDKINGWVSQKTHGKIPKILDQLSGNSVCAILNAIYFKGAWQSPFEKRATRNDDFKISSSRQVTVSFMKQEEHLQILDEHNFQAVSIPYKGEHMSMVIFLPKKPNGLASLEKQMSKDRLQKWLGELSMQPSRDVDLSIPKFKLATDYNLIPACKLLGIKDAFNLKAADFSNMGRGIGDVAIGQIIHKAFVDVSEEGTEAAAATVVELYSKGVVDEEQLMFIADHPFIFLIRHNQTGAILFMGRVIDPTAG